MTEVITIPRKPVITVKNELNVGGTTVSYNWPFLTQQTSYRTYDEGHQWANIWSAVFAAENTAIDAGTVYEKPVLVDFYTLAKNNSFGNTSRFTLTDGTALSTLQAALTEIVDNYLGIRMTYFSGASVSNNNAIDNAAAYDDAGWRLMPKQLIECLCDKSTIASTQLNNVMPSGGNNWSSTTAGTTTNAYYRFGASHQWGELAKTSGGRNGGLVYRKHF